MIDLKEGDILVVSSVDYPVRSVGEWVKTSAHTKSFLKLATVTASTKRSPAIASGKRGSPATNLTGLSCFPFDPVQPELARRLALDTPHELLQTYLSDGTGFLAVIIEDLKR
jgi:hypothetical protein